MIQFTVYGEPIAQARPRFTTAGGFVRAYDPRKSRDYKDYVRLVAVEKAPKEPIDGPVSLTVRVFRPIPKSFSRKKVELAENGEIRPTTKPDADNYLKAVKDALKGIVWRDDSQVVEVKVGKWYSSRPRVEIEIQEIGKGA